MARVAIAVETSGGAPAMIQMRNPLERLAAIVVDFLLDFVGLFLPAPPRVLPPAPRVLVIRCDHLGDAVMATGVLRSLREGLGAGRIDVLAGPWAAELFGAHPAVDGVIAWAAPWWLAARGASLRAQWAACWTLPSVLRQVRAGHYDVAIDLRGDLRQIVLFLLCGGAARRVSSDRTGGRAVLTDTAHFDHALHEVEQNAMVVRALGIACPAAVDVAIPPLAPELARRLQPHGKERGVLGVALRANATNKGWPADLAVDFLRRVQRDTDLTIAYVGGPADERFGDQLARHLPERFVNLAGKCTVLEMLSVLHHCRAALSVDSGPMHFAAAAGVPLIALFGPTESLRYGPWSDQAITLHGTEPCHCAGKRCRFTADGIGRCMRSISPDQVFDALGEIVAHPSMPRGAV